MSEANLEWGPLERIAQSLARIEAVICNPPLISVPGNLTDEQAAKLRDMLAKDGPGPLILSGIDGSRTIIGRRTTEITFEGTAPEPSVRLGEAAPGLYLFKGELICKTQYSTDLAGGGAKPDCYIVASGEYFCGGEGVTSREIKDLMVTPVVVNHP